MGKVLKDIGGLKFDAFSAEDLADMLETEGFADRFRAAVDDWYNNANQSVSADTLKLRERQYKACVGFIDAGNHKRLAHAIRTMIKHDALRWSESGERGDYGMTLQRAVTELCGINVTAARRMKLTAGF